MTRAERRRVERENRGQPTYNLSRNQLWETKQEVIHDATETAFLMMPGIPALMFKDHFGQLIRREVDGKSREQRFVDYCIELYRQFDKGLYILDDIHLVLKDECDIEIEMEQAGEYPDSKEHHKRTYVRKRSPVCLATERFLIFG